MAEKPAGAPCSEGVVKDSAAEGSKLPEGVPEAESAPDEEAPGASEESVWSDGASAEVAAERGRGVEKAGSGDLSTRCF